MQTTIEIETYSQNFVLQQISVQSKESQNFPGLFDSLLEKLEIILDKHKSCTDELSQGLFTWGDKAITLADLIGNDTQRLKEVASKHLEVLEEMLISTQIDIKAQEAKLPLTLNINAFALVMFNWMKETQHLLDYSSNSEIVNSLQKVNLSLLPTSIALEMYHHLRSNQKKIEEAKALRCQIKATPIKPAPSLSTVRQSLMEEVREAKAEMERKLLELEKLTNLKIEIMEERHKIEIEVAEFRLNNAERDLREFKIKLAFAEENNTLNSQKILQLNGEIKHLKSRLDHLENELDNDSGGCIIS